MYAHTQWSIILLLFKDKILSFARIWVKMKAVLRETSQRRNKSAR